MSSRQSNRRTGAQMREQLIEAGLRLLEEVGPEALQARRVAAAVGTSTMAVYTHFEGMPGLLSAIVREAFIRFGAALGGVAPTEDPVADFLVMGAAYRRYALDSPQRYRLMFGLASPPTASTHDFTVESLTEGSGTETFQQLVTVVRRMIEAGRIRADPPHQVAARLWGLIHGVVLLELTGHLGNQDQALLAVLGPATRDLLVGMGSDATELDNSLQRALRTMTATPGLALEAAGGETESG